jgi:asparagine synthase (glutamine-hydrolysing)
MCGIAGILDLSSGRAPTRDELEAMIGTLQHRGPDGYGFFQEGPCGFAHARLSIIDLNGGWQPIYNETRDVCVISNGEIFNYIELRAELEVRGHRFYTQSDTEVIVHLYEEFGEEFVDHLNGQFAIALYDMRKRRLVLARDRVGIRPLFYAEHGGRLAFASEVKALFALPDIPREIDFRGVAQVLCIWSCTEPLTPFRGVQALPPGTVLVVDDDGQRHERRYWDWDFPPEPIHSSRSPGDLAEELRALLIESVRLQLRADVPVGAYLSGGLDSSIIAALVGGYTHSPLRTFSIGFEDPEFDERAFQSEMAAHLGTTHTSVVCTAEDIGREFPKVVWHCESPIVRTAPAPLMLLSRSVREAGFRAVLTGEGADETFGGYDIFREAKVRRFWARNSASSWRAGLLERLYPYLRHSPTASHSFARKFYGQGLDQVAAPEFAHLPRWKTTQRAWQLFSPAIRTSLGNFDPKAELLARLPGRSTRWPGMCRDQWVEAHTLLSGYLLSSQGDRMMMANSIEGRFPFLDHRVIEFANMLPPYLKVRGLTEKYLLRRSVDGLVPESIRHRIKQPYRASDSASFFRAGASLDYIEELLQPGRVRACGLFEPAAVERLVAKCRAGKAIGFSDNMAFVGVLSTLLLEELFVRGPRVAGVPAPVPWRGTSPSQARA